MNYHGKCNTPHPHIHIPLSLYMNQVAHIPNDTHEFNPKLAANLRRPSKDNMVGRFKLDGRCKKHPKHVQSPGVCSLCLRDKLAQLAVAASTSQKTTSGATADSSSCSSSSSLSSYYSSSSASSCASPLHFSTEGKTATGSSVSIFLFPKHGGLVKSRSMAAVPRRRRKRDSDESVVISDRKKSGFWFKLFHPKNKSKRMENYKLVRTGSVRETVTVAAN